MTQIGNQVCGRKLKKDDIWAFGFVNFPQENKRCGEYIRHCCSDINLIFYMDFLQWSSH